MGEATVFVQSMGIGFAIAAPVGPIGLLVIQRTLQHGRLAGLATGLGAALADAVYGAIGAFGVAALIGALQAARVPLALFGGAFLWWLAWRTWSVTPAAAPGATGARSDSPQLAGALAGTFALTLSNPATILSFVAIFGAMAGRGAVASPVWMVLGVLLGSALWWLVLSTVMGAVRHRLHDSTRRLISRASALALAAFAAWQWAGLLGPS